VIKFIYWLVLGCISWGLEAQPLGTRPLPETFSTDMIVTTKEQVMRATLFADKGKMRMEMGSGSGPSSGLMGMNGVMILRDDQMKIYMLMTGQRMYMEMPIPDGDKLPGGFFNPADGIFEKVGTETIRGVLCETYKASTKDQKQVGILAFDAARQVPMRFTEGQGKAVVDFENFKTSPLSASLFEVPAGFTKMVLPGGMTLPPGMGQ
jgi:hypothetical protein